MEICRSILQQAPPLPGGICTCSAMYITLMELSSGGKILPVRPCCQGLPFYKKAPTKLLLKHGSFSQRTPPLPGGICACSAMYISFAVLPNRCGYVACTIYAQSCAPTCLKLKELRTLHNVRGNYFVFSAEVHCLINSQQRTAFEVRWVIAKGPPLPGGM